MFQAYEKPRPAMGLSNIGATYALILFSYFLPESLYDVADNEATTVHAVTSDGGGQDTLRVELSFRDRYKRDVKVNALLDKRMHYLPIRISMTIQDIAIQVENAFQEVASELVVLKSRTFSYQLARGQFTGKAEYLFKLHTDPWNEADFTLSAFGFEERLRR